MTEVLERIATALEDISKKLSEMEGLGEDMVSSLSEDVCGKLSEIEKNLYRLEG